MKLIHSVTISIFSSTEQSQDQIDQIFKSLIPINFEKQNIDYKKQEIETDNMFNLVTHSLKIVRQPHIKLFLNELVSKLDDHQKTWLKENAHNRLDEHAVFYLRLDLKNLQNNKFIFVNHGKCAHIKIKLAPYPKNMENAKKVLDEVINILVR